MNRSPDPTEAEIFASSDPFGSGAPAFGGSAPTPGLGTPAASPPAVRPHVRVSCIEVHQSLEIFLDGELSAPQHRALAEHLTACPPCRRAHSFQLQLRTVVATKAFDPMPDDVRARITRALGFE